MTIVGIGGINDTATVISSGILSKNDFLLLGLQGAVGDLLSQFIDKDGNKVDNDLHEIDDKQENQAIIRTYRTHCFL